MRIVRCITIDDEPLALERMMRLINSHERLQCVGAYSSARQAVEAMREVKADLVFMDIEMPGMNGLELAKKLCGKLPVVFTTAYEQYAIKGFDLNVLDYLLKPVSAERFKLACTKAIDKIDAAERNEANIIVPSEYQTHRLLLKDILYVEGLKDYVKIFCTTSEKPVLTRQNLKKIESQLTQEQGFFRVHKSFIVSINKVDSASRQKVHVQEREIPLGESFKEVFLETFFRYRTPD